jgi:tetratricopeptide (TPR) repeat protein
MHAPIRAIRHSAFLALLVPAVLAAQVPVATPPAGDAVELVKQGRKLGAEGKHDEAIALYQRALSLSPTLADAHLAIGVALDLKGEYAEARPHIARGIELADAKSKAGALKTMAMSYAFEGKADEASTYERQVFDTQIAAGDFIGAAETSNELARIYIESGSLDSAFTWYRTGYQTASKKPDLTAAEKDLWDFRWHHAQARIAARRGQGDAALQHVAMAKAALDKGTNPDQQRFLPYLTGYVAFYAGDLKKAIADLEQADLRDPFILSLLAQAYEKSGEPALAMDHWRKVLAINSHNPTNAFARPLARKRVM